MLLLLLLLPLIVLICSTGHVILLSGLPCWLDAALITKPSGLLQPLLLLPSQLAAVLLLPARLLALLLPVLLVMLCTRLLPLLPSAADVGGSRLCSIVSSLVTVVMAAKPAKSAAELPLAQLTAAAVMAHIAAASSSPVTPSEATAAQSSLAACAGMLCNLVAPSLTVAGATPAAAAAVLQPSLSSPALRLASIKPATGSNTGSLT
jgi:hypothetical protein